MASLAYCRNITHDSLLTGTPCWRLVPTPYSSHPGRRKNPGLLAQCVAGVRSSILSGSINPHAKQWELRKAPPGSNLTAPVGKIRCVEDVSGALRMSRTEDYRRYARECMELSRLVNTEKTRTILSHMAQVWLRLADQKNDPGATLKDEQPG
jgi:hypothetical protein